MSYLPVWNSIYQPFSFQNQTDIPAAAMKRKLCLSVQSMTLLDARMVSREQVQMWQRRKQARRQAQAAQVENLVKAQAGEGSEGQAGQTGGAEKAQAAGEAVSAH